MKLRNKELCDDSISNLIETLPLSETLENFEDFFPIEFTWRTVFKTSIEHNSFLNQSSIKIMEVVSAKITCDRCKSKFFEYGRNNSETWSLSIEMSNFILSMEFAFRKLSSETESIDSLKFRETFKDVILTQVDLTVEHCFSTVNTIISIFIKFCTKLELHQRFPHRRNAYASKCN
ncbi:hypothetical protein PVAND_002291 [Polypedilum vanderplanki]|uniref:Uncharacterized protein n=1 Tax=Polypedilum vanderplanki TaxID=319348 RepID=A0A9J6BQI8_POLVA|nr:hypothetical protein PVAND_002291 [Polypedilum vanderplanki]